MYEVSTKLLKRWTSFGPAVVQDYRTRRCVPQQHLYSHVTHLIDVFYSTKYVISVQDAFTNLARAQRLHAIMDHDSWCESHLICMQHWQCRQHSTP